MTRQLWNPEYAAIVAARNAGIRAVGRRTIEAAYRQRQALAALCDCDGLNADPTTHRAWCCYRASTERPPPVYTFEGEHPSNCACETCAKGRP